MVKNNIPIAITTQDVEDKTLLIRALRTMSEKVASLEDKHDALHAQVVAIPPQLTQTQITRALESDGPNPLNIQNLHGVAGEPQLAKLPRYDTKPKGLALQQLQDGHIFAVKNGAAWQVYMVMGGNPNTLFQLI